MRSRLSLFAVVGVVTASLCGCSSVADSTAPSASAPAVLEVLDVPPLPSGRNGVELIPVDVVTRSVLAAIDSQDSVVVRGSLVRRLTSQDGSVTVETPLAFTMVGTEHNFEAEVAFGDATVVVKRLGDDVWVQGNEVYATAMGAPAVVSGVCVAPDDDAFAPWRWLDGPRAIVETLLGVAALGSPMVTGTGADALVQYPLGAGGPVVGSFSVAASGEPLPALIEVDDLSGVGVVEFAQWSAEGVGDSDGCGDLDS